MKLTSILLLLASFIGCNANISLHYRKLQNKRGCSYFRNIDYIYLINLDQRPEKLENCMQQLNLYRIIPERFPAIYGWSLSSSELNEIGMKFLPGMWRGNERVLYFPLHSYGKSLYVNLDESCYGHTFFSTLTSLGAIGCTLSHLSVLQDAYDSGYETIWIMEDDISVQDNPLLLPDLIDKLDSLVGKEGWDLLHTDLDYLFWIDPNRELRSQMPWQWRPDMPEFDLRLLLEFTPVGENFVKVGYRLRTHSLIFRRSGMRKVLEFYKNRNMFMPYDHELFFIPEMQIYVLRNGVVTFHETSSDTKNRAF